jgi:hypothetical protein
VNSLIYSSGRGLEQAEQFLTPWTQHFSVLMDRSHRSRVQNAQLRRSSGALFIYRAAQPDVWPVTPVIRIEYNLPIPKRLREALTSGIETGNISAGPAPVYVGGAIEIASIDQCITRRRAVRAER